MKANEGDVVPVGNVVCHIDTSVKKSVKKHIEVSNPTKDDKLMDKDPEPSIQPEKIMSEKANSSPSPPHPKF